jgi:hypothetical protein
METKKIGVIIVLSVLLSGSLTSCLEKGQNIRDFSAIPSYVTTSDGKMMLETLIGKVYTSGLTYDQLDTYGIYWFNVNYDNQPAGTDGINVPYTATINGWISVPSGYLSMRGEEIPDYYNDTISTAAIIHPTLLRNHTFFMMGERNVPKDREYNYLLTFNTDSTTKYGIPMLYLQTEVMKPGSGSTVENLDCFYAFDMGSLINSSYAKDSTIENVNCKIVRFNLYYQSGIDRTTNKPIFKAASDKEQLILAPKDNNIE